MEISCVGLDRQEMIKKIMEREQRDKIQKEEKGLLIIDVPKLKKL